MKKQLHLLLAVVLFMVFTAGESFAQNFFDDFETGVLSDAYTIINGDGLIPADPGDIGWADTAWIVTTSSTFDGYGVLSISWYEDENGNEVGPANDWLILPKLTLGPDAKLTFDVKSATSSGDYPDDYWVLINTGDPTIESFENDGEILLQITDEVSFEFRTEEIDLSDYAGQEVHIAFVNVTNTLGYGLWLDNIGVSSTTATSEVRPDFFNLSVAPNPAGNFARLRYDLPQADNVEILIRDVFGRTVASVQQDQQPTGLHDLGLPIENLNPGTYLVTLRTAEKVATTRLLIAR